MESQQARDSLQQVKERHDEIIKIQKSLEDLLSLFHELAFLVESQAPIIDKIEDNITSTAINTEKGKSALRDGKRKRRKYLKVNP